jgi:hypothetical protein
MTMPRLANHATARLRKAVALLARSSAKISAYVSHEWSSMAT